MRDEKGLVIDPNDLIVIRQVLQRNANEDIKRFLDRLKGKCKFLVISEHIPAQFRRANVDVLTGLHTRHHLESGDFVDQQPFCVEVGEVHELTNWYENGYHRITISTGQNAAG